MVLRQPDEPAAGVRVSGVLDASGEVAKTEEMLDFMAPAEEATVTFIFDRDPRSGRLSVSVRAFMEP